MIIRILIVIILLLSVLNIIGQPASDKAASHRFKQGHTNQDTPTSLVPVIELFSGFTFLLLCQSYLNRKLYKIKAASARYRNNKQFILRKAVNNKPVFANSWQQA